MTIVKDWPKLLTSDDVRMQQSHLHSFIGFSLQRVLNQMPTYGTDDLLIVSRGGIREVWTLKQFKPGALMFGPDTTEFKDRFWTQARSSIVGNTDKLNPDDSKCYVFDGRLRSTIADARSFAFFWAIERSEKGAECNLVEGLAELSITEHITLPCTAAPIHKVLLAKDVPQVRVLYNSVPIKKHTRLVAPWDKMLRTLAEKNAADEIKKKKKADELKRKADTKVKEDKELSSKKVKVDGH